MLFSCVQIQAGFQERILYISKWQIGSNSTTPHSNKHYCKWLRMTYFSKGPMGKESGINSLDDSSQHTRMWNRQFRQIRQLYHTLIHLFLFLFPWFQRSFNSPSLNKTLASPARSLPRRWRHLRDERRHTYEWQGTTVTTARRRSHKFRQRKSSRSEKAEDAERQPPDWPQWVYARVRPTWAIACWGLLLQLLSSS